MFMLKNKVRRFHTVHLTEYKIHGPLINFIPWAKNCQFPSGYL